MDKWLDVGIKGHAAWPTKETKVTFGGYELLLKPGTKNTEQSVHINLKGISQQEALTLINRFLSILSWCDGVPMENLYGLSGGMLPGVISRITISVFGSCIGDYPFHRDVDQNHKTCLALALYREAFTVNSVPFSFLSCFKIMNVFWKDSKEHIEGIRETLSKLKDEWAIKRIEQLSEKEADIPRYLY